MLDEYGVHFIMLNGLTIFVVNHVGPDIWRLIKKYGLMLYRITKNKCISYRDTLNDKKKWNDYYNDATCGLLPHPKYTIRQANIDRIVKQCFDQDVPISCAREIIGKMDLLNRSDFNVLFIAAACKIIMQNGGSVFQWDGFSIKRDGMMMSEANIPNHVASSLYWKIFGQNTALTPHKHPQN